MHRAVRIRQTAISRSMFVIAAFYGCLALSGPIHPAAASDRSSAEAGAMSQIDGGVAHPVTDTTTHIHHGDGDAQGLPDRGVGTFLVELVQTIWFKLALGLAGILASLGIVRNRISYLKLRQRTLETELAARTADLAAAKRQLEQIAHVDALTALPNRRRFGDDLEKVLAQARRRGVGFALLLLDLDRFRQINDTLGHDAGDALLVAAAKRFKAAVREADFVARLGGDEFAIILSESHDPAAIDAVCRRIVESFRDPAWYKGQAMRSSPSIGIARYPEHGLAPEDLFKAADLALHDAKYAGRNTWRWHQAPAIGEAAA